MLRLMITDQLWSRLAPLLKEFKIHFSNRIRIFMEAVFWKLRTGAPWRDLPTEFGSYSTVFNKFNRWSKLGIWQKLFLKIRGELDNEWNFIDSTIVKAHQYSVNSKCKKRECIGRSVCGNSSKIHMLSDSHGNPIDFIISEGQVHDSKIANQLIEISDAESLIADRGYGDQKIRANLANKKIQAVIPKRRNALDKANTGFDKYLYKIRHLIENLFARLKQFRSIATRYDKSKNNYASFIYIGSSLIWGKI
ncbi:IS5 family transposase [Spirobacillus cienkowskii]|uniref:IS5 family transposase n=1 Tax=Spirobacillus cienkowskii TaxID=495820 RepID=UPI0030D4EE22